MKLCSMKLCSMKLCNCFCNEARDCWPVGLVRCVRHERISIRGSVCQFVHPSVGPYVRYASLKIEVVGTFHLRRRGCPNHLRLATFKRWDLMNVVGV